MDELRPLVPLLPLVLPLVGKLLLLIPWVPNKGIPLVNAVVATIAKYWYLAGFGVLGEVPAPVPGAEHGALAQHVMLAGFFGELGRAGLSIAWGCLDSAAAGFFYEAQRRGAKLRGQVSWWEQGKASLWGKKAA